MIFIDFIATVAAYVLVTLVGWYRMAEPLIGDAGIVLFLSFALTCLWQYNIVQRKGDSYEA